jgi:hypothetical protein
VGDSNSAYQQEMFASTLFLFSDSCLRIEDFYQVGAIRQDFEYHY